MGGEANIWNPRTLLELSADTKRVEEKLTAVAGQTLFTLQDFVYSLGTGSLAVYQKDIASTSTDKGAGLLTKGVDWTEGTDSTFSLVAPASAGDVIVAVGHVAITADVDVRDTDIYVTNYQAIRDYAGTEITLYSQGQSTAGDNRQRFFHKLTGAAPGFYVDDNNNILVPTGGDGSIGWLAEENNYSYSFDTVANAAAGLTSRGRTVILAIGDVITIKERNNASFDVISGTGTANAMDIIAHATLSLSFVLRVRYSDMDITEFGAVGDGATDVTTIIQRALDLGDTDTEFSIVTIPTAADFFMFTQLHVNSKQTLKGTGGKLKLIAGTIALAGSSYYPINNLGEQQTTFEGLYVDANEPNNPVVPVVADTITCVGFLSKVTKCTLLSAVDSGIMFSDSLRGECSHNYVEGARDLCIYTNGAEGSERQRAKMVHNTCKAGVNGGIAIKRGARLMDVSYNIITDCGNGITHEDFGVGGGGHPEEINICNNLIEDIGYNYRAPTVAESGISLNRPTNCSISNNTIINVSGNGIALSGGFNVDLHGNNITGYAADPKVGSNNGILVLKRIDPITAGVTESDKIRIIGGSVKDSTEKGIWIQDASTNVKVIGASVDVGNSGIRTEAGTDKVTLYGNDIDAGNGADFEIVGGTNLIIDDNITVNQTTDIRYYAGNPNGVITPRVIGEELFDSTGTQWYRASGLTNTDWH